MNVAVRFLLILVASFALAHSARAQDEQICSELGIIVEMDAPRRRTFVVFGRVNVKRAAGEKKLPTVVVWLREGGRSTQRMSLEGSGNYCFRRSSTGGEITVEVDGQEAGRRTLLSNIPQQREDFDVRLAASTIELPPGVVSVKFNYPRNEKNSKLYGKAVKADTDGKPDKAIEFLTQIVSADPADYIAWGKIGSVYFQQKKFPEAGAAFKRSVEINAEFTPAWINLAQAQFLQKQFESAIESCKRAATLDPKAAMSFYILGHAYLQTRQGKPAIDALNEAIRLDPSGMTECHLILAHLYDINGAKRMASREYRIFLSKVPDHPDKARFEKYIKDNPE
jgi:tetratricopeptide (TPR) repeat protein